jgi:hypothetical protein
VHGPGRFNGDGRAGSGSGEAGGRGGLLAEEDRGVVGMGTWGGRRGGSGGHQQDSRRDGSAAGGEGSGAAARGWRRKGRWSGGDRGG